MTVCQYCTPEWFEELEKVYAAEPAYAEQFKKLTMLVCYRVKAEPDWGIDRDIIFGNDMDAGTLVKLGFYTEAEAKNSATFILSATPQEWKRILRKESKFVTDCTLGKIKLEQGSKVGILKLAPLSDKLVGFLTTYDIRFPDEMSPDELSTYRAYMKEFREELGI